METSQIITLFSGAGIGALLSAILVFVNNSKRNQLDYITKERSEWRTKLKHIIEELYNDEQSTEKTLVELKSQINPYGYRLNLKYNENYYLQDGHIWDLLNDFNIEEQREELVYFLELLLKFDWERSKSEIYFKIKEFMIKFLILLLSFLGISLFIYHLSIPTDDSWLVVVDFIATAFLLMNLSAEKLYPKIIDTKFMLSFLLLLALPEFYVVRYSIQKLFLPYISNSILPNIAMGVALVVMMILELYVLLIPNNSKDQYLEKLVCYRDSEYTDVKEYNKIQNSISKMTYGKQYISKKSKSELRKWRNQRLKVLKKYIKQKYPKANQKHKLKLLKQIIKNYHSKEQTHV